MKLVINGMLFSLKKNTYDIILLSYKTKFLMSMHQIKRMNFRSFFTRTAFLVDHVLFIAHTYEYEAMLLLFMLVGRHIAAYPSLTKA